MVSIISQLFHHRTVSLYLTQQERTGGSGGHLAQLVRSDSSERGAVDNQTPDYCSNDSLPSQISNIQLCILQAMKNYLRLKLYLIIYIM